MFMPAQLHGFPRPVKDATVTLTAIRAPLVAFALLLVALPFRDPVTC
jgi:hypothetical protein